MKILIAPWSKKMRSDWQGAPEINPKNFPHWKELIELLKDHEIIQIGVDGEEELVKDFRKGLSLDQLSSLLFDIAMSGGCVISVDSFLPHLIHNRIKVEGCNWARVIVLWGPSDPKHFGYEEQNNLLKDVKYLRPDQFGVWEQCKYNPEAFVSPEEVKKVVDFWEECDKNK